MTLSKQRLQIPGGAGGPLAAVLQTPGADAPVRGTVVLAHCFTCTKDIAMLTRLSRALTRAGFAALRFDFSGLGESAGDFATTTVSSDIADLVTVCRWLAERQRPVDALVGHSLGGTVALLAAAQVPTVRAVAVVNAPAEPSHLGRLFSDAADVIRAQGHAEVELAGRPFPISRAFLDDLGVHDTAAAVAGLDVDLLVVHAVDDEEVPLSEAEAVVAASGGRARLVRLPEGDHLLTARSSAEAAVDAVLSWLGDALADAAAGPARPGGARSGGARPGGAR